jgi:spore maturation protein CgeB
MTFFFLTTYYPPFLSQFLNKVKNIDTLTHQELELEILKEFFADTGSLKFHTAKAGHHTFMSISNCEVLQKKWAIENNLKYTHNWFYEIAYEQIKYFKPDVFYIEYVPQLFGEFIKLVKPFCKKVVSWISSPLDASAELSGIDLIFSSTPDFVKLFKQSGIQSQYMHPAFDVRILDQMPKFSSKSIPFSFVGGWSDVHINRKKALKHLAQNTPIQIWGYNYKDNYSKRSFAYFKNLILNENKKVFNAYHGEAWGLEMYKIIRNSLITFNIHESLLKGFVGNMRMFEASGAGTMILNDTGHNLPELFIPGKEIETYTSIEEAVEKVKFYIENPNLAIEIGKNAQLKTTRDYNYDIYVTEMSSYINKLF